MTEIRLTQRSKEWFQLRESLLLTASRFGDAIGVGTGKAHDFLISLISDDPVYDSHDVTPEINHGLDTEPIIDEAYEILTGHVTQKSGFWMPHADNVLYGISGASPDAKVYDVSDPERIIGLGEYKSPVYNLYCLDRHPPHGIPRRYMAQIQGQMSICKLPWCDFMAVCTRTKDIILRRVYFSKVYWTSVSRVIKHFCDVLQEALSRKDDGLDPLNFPAAKDMKQLSNHDRLYCGENDIITENLLWKTTSRYYKTKRGTFSYEFLMGTC